MGFFSAVENYYSTQTHSDTLTHRRRRARRSTRTQAQAQPKGDAAQGTSSDLSGNSVCGAAAGSWPA